MDSVDWGDFLRCSNSAQHNGKGFSVNTNSSEMCVHEPDCSLHPVNSHNLPNMVLGRPIITWISQ